VLQTKEESEPNVEESVPNMDKCKLHMKLSQVEGGVIIAPLVLDGALVVPAVRLVGFLKHTRQPTHTHKNNSRWGSYSPGSQDVWQLK
jgi:hypothetical protein